MARHLDRKSKNLSQKKRFPIISEGEVTERQYFDAVRETLYLRSAEVLFVPPGPTSPLEIVKKARTMREDNQKTDPFDETWCVFDVEAKVNQAARPGLRDALALAKTSRISIALSNPCFELWLLLHQESQYGFITSDAVQSKCSTSGIVIGKHLPNAQQLFNNYQQARQYALALEAQHDRNLTAQEEDRNPSSKVYLLVDALLTAFPHRN